LVFHDQKSRSSERKNARSKPKHQEKGNIKTDKDERLRGFVRGKRPKRKQQREKGFGKEYPQSGREFVKKGRQGVARPRSKGKNQRKEEQA